MCLIRTAMLSAALMFSANVAATAQETTDGSSTFLVIEHRPVVVPQIQTSDEFQTMMQGQSQIGVQTREEEVQGDRINDQMKTILTSFAGLFEDMESGYGVALDEVTLRLEVTAEGHVGLLGIGASAGTTGGVQVVLRRPRTPQP